MGQTNSKRVSHTLTDGPNSFRDDHMKQIINDIDEELFDRGFVEVIRSGVFITTINVWKTSSKLIKRADVVFDRTGDPPFINECVVQVYDEVDGTIVKSTTTTTIVRTGNKQISSIDTSTVR